jgi:hypothetical protein
LEVQKLPNIRSTILPKAYSVACCVLCIIITIPMPTSGPDAMQPALRRRRRRQGFLLPFACLSAALIAAALLPGAAFADGVTPSEARRLRDEVVPALLLRSARS